MNHAMIFEGKDLMKREIRKNFTARKIYYFARTTNFADATALTAG
jgi:hypothetical protein